jgi:hypothetical protein
VNFQTGKIKVLFTIDDNSVTPSFNFRSIVFFVLVISLRSLSSISSRCLFTDSRTLLISTKTARKCEQVVTIDKAVYGVNESSKATELLTKLKDMSVKISEILTTRKDNVSRFEEETNAVLVEISKVRESVNKHLDEIEDKLRNEMTSTPYTALSIVATCSHFLWWTVAQTVQQDLE